MSEDAAKLERLKMAFGSKNDKVLLQTVVRSWIELFYHEKYTVRMQTLERTNAELVGKLAKNFDKL